MTPLTRDRRAAVIPATFRGARQARRDLQLLQWHLDPNRKDLKSSQWKGAKRQLGIESHGKCAYCDAPAWAVAHCDVEHFRPKSVYWWLALCYDNYLFACQICNQVYKGDEFPTYGTRIMEPHVDPTMTQAQLQAVVGTFAPDPLNLAEVTRFAGLWAAEQPGLFNPYTNDHEPLFGYEVDRILREVSVVPNPAASTAEQRMAQDSVRLYGLNREELRTQRFITFEVLEAAYLAYLDSPHNTKLVNILRLQLSADFPFSRMNGYFVRQVWTIPGL